MSLRLHMPRAPKRLSRVEAEPVGAYRPEVVIREVALMAGLEEQALRRSLARRASRARLVACAVACLWSSASAVARVLGRSVSVVSRARACVRDLRETDPDVARLWARCMTTFTRQEKTP